MLIGSFQSCVLFYQKYFVRDDTCPPQTYTLFKSSLIHLHFWSGPLVWQWIPWSYHSLQQYYQLLNFKLKTPNFTLSAGPGIEIYRGGNRHSPSIHVLLFTLSYFYISHVDYSNLHFPPFTNKLLIHSQSSSWTISSPIMPLSGGGVNNSSRASVTVWNHEKVSQGFLISTQ